MTKQKKIFALIFAFAFFSILLTSCGMPENFGAPNKKARKILNELNENWTLGDLYAVDYGTAGDNIPTEWLHKKGEKPGKAILHLHGGAYVRNLDYGGNLYRRMAQQYADISGAGVLTVDYRTAPENPYPAALEDALTAYYVLLNGGFKGQDIIIAGDSAGGGLALALTLYLRDHGVELPAGIVTMSAWTKLDYLFKTTDYAGKHNDPKDPYISPYYGDFRGFPPMLMQVGTKDITNDTVKTAQKAKKAGVSVTQTTYKNMFHVFQALFPKLDEANAAWNEVETFINAIF
ncbi:MAG: alpha/beta hydrolase [Clostridiales bacterium]|jgi:acetyl esterase/lipase|nr:alpha/beta hydrolase [Clostridiales bacterium]